MSQATIQYSRELPVRWQTEVAVLGGGIAGVTTACAAARAGAQVVLVERFAVTGGNATVGGVANWSGETRGQGAIFDEIIAMQEEWQAIAPYPGPYEHFGKCSNRVFDHAILGIILQELLRRHGVKVLLHTRFVDVVTEGRRITHAVLRGNGGPEALAAKVFVDCTGQAEVTHSAGFSTIKGRDGDHCQLPPSMMAFVREVPGPITPQVPPGWFAPITRAEDLPMTSIWPHGPGAKALKIKVPGYDTTDTEAMTALEQRARARFFEVLDYYQRVEGKNWRCDHLSPQIGLREGRRGLGDYQLSLADLRAGRAFDDGVARGVFYLDGMSPDNDKRTYILTKEEQVVPPYQIPLRSLIARDGDNLLLAGRCFSADQLALSSARVMTSCAMMGQAAGTWAGLAATSNALPRAIPAAAIREIVLSHGANLAV